MLRAELREVERVFKPREALSPPAIVPRERRGTARR